MFRTAAMAMLVLAGAACASDPYGPVSMDQQPSEPQAVWSGMRVLKVGMRPARVLSALGVERRLGWLVDECKRDPACEVIILVGRRDGLHLKFAPDASGVGSLQLAELHGDGGRILKVGN
jgi:hypothetical protein